MNNLNKIYIITMLLNSQICQFKFYNIALKCFARFETRENIHL